LCVCPSVSSRRALNPSVSQAAKFPSLPIYGGSNQIPALTKLVKDKEEFTLGENTLIRYLLLGLEPTCTNPSPRCLATPCHTQDSICYYATDIIDKSQPGVVFTGDTLFIAGCGRFFEGSAEEMDKALTYLGTLPDDTIVHNGHEYTAGNLAFAKSVDPDNKALQRLADLVKQNNITTGLTTIKDEKQWNVFMRLASDAVRLVPREN
jgi:hydroxyacylglutathione hydrolase